MLVGPYILFDFF